MILKWQWAGHVARCNCSELLSRVTFWRDAEWTDGSWAGRPAAEKKSKRARKEAPVVQAAAVGSVQDDDELAAAGEADDVATGLTAAGMRAKEERENKMKAKPLVKGAKPLEDFPICAETVALLNGHGMTSLFPIQHLTFQNIFDGADMIGRARTGMGKTLAFALPTIERMVAVRNRVLRSVVPAAAARCAAAAAAAAAVRVSCSARTPSSASSNSRSPCHALGELLRAACSVQGPLGMALVQRRSGIATLHTCRLTALSRAAGTHAGHILLSLS